MARPTRPVTDRELKAWLAAGAVDRGVGEGLTFLASTAGARAGKASWVLRYRLHGRNKEKVLGRYPELSLKDARELARRDRAQVERGVDVAAEKQAERVRALEAPTVDRLADIWLARYIEPRYKYPEVVARVLRRHVRPVLGQMAPTDVQPVHIDRVLTRIVEAGAAAVELAALLFDAFQLSSLFLQKAERTTASRLDSALAGKGGLIRRFVGRPDRDHLHLRRSGRRAEGMHPMCPGPARSPDDRLPTLQPANGRS